MEIGFICYIARKGSLNLKELFIEIATHFPTGTWFPLASAGLLRTLSWVNSRSMLIWGEGLLLVGDFFGTSFENFIGKSAINMLLTSDLQVLVRRFLEA